MDSDDGSTGIESLECAVQRSALPIPQVTPNEVRDIDSDSEDETNRIGVFDYCPVLIPTIRKHREPSIQTVSGGVSRQVSISSGSLDNLESAVTGDTSYVGSKIPASSSDGYLGCDVLDTRRSLTELFSSYNNETLSSSEDIELQTFSPKTSVTDCRASCDKNGYISAENKHLGTCIQRSLEDSSECTEEILVRSEFLGHRASYGTFEDHMKNSIVDDRNVSDNITANVFSIPPGVSNSITSKGEGYDQGKWSTDSDNRCYSYLGGHLEDDCISDVGLHTTINPKCKFHQSI